MDLLGPHIFVSHYFYSLFLGLSGGAEACSDGWLLYFWCCTAGRRAEMSKCHWLLKKCLCTVSVFVSFLKLTVFQFRFLNVEIKNESMKVNVSKTKASVDADWLLFAAGFPAEVCYSCVLNNCVKKDNKGSSLPVWVGRLTERQVFTLIWLLFKAVPCVYKALVKLQKLMSCT